MRIYVCTWEKRRWSCAVVSIPAPPLSKEGSLSLSIFVHLSLSRWIYYRYIDTYDDDIYNSPAPGKSEDSHARWWAFPRRRWVSRALYLSISIDRSIYLSMHTETYLWEYIYAPGKSVGSRAQWSTFRRRRWGSMACAGSRRRPPGQGCGSEAAPRLPRACRPGWPKTCAPRGTEIPSNPDLDQSWVSESLRVNSYPWAYLTLSPNLRNPQRGKGAHNQISKIPSVDSTGHVSESSSLG